jgi:hypothetical protein
MLKKNNSMKNIFLICCLLFTFLVFSNLTLPNENGVVAENKDTQLPNWQWTSGQVEIETTAAKQSFTITFSPKIYRPRDSVYIIFNSYKVAITNLNKGTTFEQWQGKVSLVRFINNNWVPLVSDTSDRINRPFSGRNNVSTDSLHNYMIGTTVPLSRTLTLTTSAISFEMDNASGSPILGNGKIGVTLTTSIKGIEIREPKGLLK